MKRTVQYREVSASSMGTCPSVYIAKVSALIKVTGMLVVLLMGVNCTFWSHLGCLRQKVTVFAHSSITHGCAKEIYKKCCDTYHTVSIKEIKKYGKLEIYDNAVSVCSPLGVSLSLSHTNIGLPWGFNFNFLMSIPVTFIIVNVPPGGIFVGSFLIILLH